MIKTAAALCALGILFFQLPAHWSLLLGLILALATHSESGLTQLSKKYSSKTLQLSIILLGASLNFKSVLASGPSALLISGISITMVLIMGSVLSRLFKVSSPLAQLITSGTAICGGSAIGAIAPILKADHLSLAISLGVVFLLNGISVFIFPTLGQALFLTQEEFGLWSALAIHDTSAVVAAAGVYGDRALEMATTLKLTRALWILPLSLFFSLRMKTKGEITIPWFILFFLLNSLLFTFTSVLDPAIPYLKNIAKMGFSLTLFMVGLGLNRIQMMSLRANQILFGISLWFLTVVGSLIFVQNYI